MTYELHMSNGEVYLADDAAYAIVRDYQDGKPSSSRHVPVRLPAGTVPRDPRGCTIHLGQIVAVIGPIAES
jgi:hypothetical protein